MYMSQLTKGILALSLVAGPATTSAVASSDMDWPDGRPSVFMMIDTTKGLDVIEAAVRAELGHGYPTTSLKLREQSDIGVYALTDWAVLNRIEGLQGICGDECAPGGSMSLSRVYKYSDNVFSRKDIFIDLSRFVQTDAASGDMRIKNDDLKCLAKVIAREIQVKDSYELEALDCHKKLMKGGTSTVSNQRVNDKSLSYVIRGLLGYI